jgi:hypothetical protein
MANYHRRFIKDYSQMAHLLHDLTGDAPFRWEERQETVFQAIKMALVSSLVLALLKDQGHFHLETDALGMVTGVVLSQQQEGGTYHLVGYAFKTLTEVERNHITYDKELLAIMRALEDWQNLLLGAGNLSTCTLITRI